MSQTIAAEKRWSVHRGERTTGTVGEGAGPRIRKSRLQQLSGLLGDAGLLLVGVWLLPLVILLIGLPVVLAVRLLLAIAQRM